MSSSVTSTPQPDRKSNTLSINMGTAKREELIEFIHGCAERLRVSKQKNVELQGELKSQIEEKELHALRADVCYLIMWIVSVSTYEMYITLIRL